MIVKYKKILRQDSEKSVGMLFLFKKIVNFSFDTNFGRFSKLSPIPLHTTQSPRH